MSEKILIADIVAEVAELTSVPKNRCDDYVKAFFETIANALSVDGIAKVKGLGTFKLVSVEERKSVNVQTGAEMIIPAHSKVSFVPDKVLKDEINRPYAHLKTYVLNPDAPLDPPETDDDDSVMDESDTVETTVEQVEEVVAETASNLIAEASEAVAEVIKEVAKATEQAVSEVKDVIEQPSEKKVEEAASPVDEKVENEPETEQTEETADNSDWFDNWEVEYEAAGQKEEEEEPAEKPKPASLSELLAKAEADRNEREEPSEPAKPEVVEEPKTEGGEEESEDNLIPENIKTPEQIVAEVMASVKGADYKADRVEDESAEPEEVAEPTNQSVQEPVADVSEPVMEKAADEVVNETVSADAEVVSETASVSETTAQNEEQVAPAKGDVSENPDEEKVQHGKVLGVAIIAFLVLLGAAIFGLLKVDPDFFKSLKAGSDNTTIVPADTSSLAQELSAYTDETEEDSTSVDASAANDQPEETIEETVKEELAKPMPPEAVIDPLWDGEFVAYMKREHKDVNLGIKGFNKEVAIKQGLFLTKVALDNYGDKSYWIYLYLYNKDRIKNPNNVPIGTKIRVPILDESLVNGTEEKTVEMAKEIRKVFVK